MLAMAKVVESFGWKKKLKFSQRNFYGNFRNRLTAEHQQLEANDLNFFQYFLEVPKFCHFQNNQICARLS